MAKELKDLFSVRKDLGPSSRIVENTSFPGANCFDFKLINPFLPTRSLRLQAFLVAVLNIIDVVVLMVTAHNNSFDLRRCSLRTSSLLYCVRHLTLSVSCLGGGMLAYFCVCDFTHYKKNISQDRVSSSRSVYQSKAKREFERSCDTKSSFKNYVLLSVVKSSCGSRSDRNEKRSPVTFLMSHRGLQSR